MIQLLCLFRQNFLLTGILFFQPGLWEIPSVIVPHPSFTPPWKFFRGFIQTDAVLWIFFFIYRLQAEIVNTFPILTKGAKALLHTEN